MDFSSLSDEQLLQLLESILRETISRGDTVADAAREVMLSEKEKADIAQAATQRAKERIKQEEIARAAREAEDKIRAQAAQAETKKKQDEQAALWAAKKDQATRMLALLSPEYVWVNVWKSTSGEKRVYLNDGEPHGRKTREIGCLYVTGNHKQAPGSMAESSWLKGKDEATRKAVKALCVEIGKYWNSVTIDCTEAASYEPAN